MNSAYIEVVCQHAAFRHYLTDSDLQEIGEFTRENVTRFSNSRNRPYGWAEYTPVLDIHAVCGDIDIPWAVETIRQEWSRHFPQGWDKWLAEAKHDRNVRV
jgi:hypothetical protein